MEVIAALVVFCACLGFLLGLGVTTFWWSLSTFHLVPLLNQDQNVGILFITIIIAAIFGPIIIWLVK